MLMVEINNKKTKSTRLDNSTKSKLKKIQSSILKQPNIDRIKKKKLKKKKKKKKIELLKGKIEKINQLKNDLKNKPNQPGIICQTWIQAMRSK